MTRIISFACWICVFALVNKREFGVDLSVLSTHFGSAADLLMLSFTTNFKVPELTFLYGSFKMDWLVTWAALLNTNDEIQASQGIIFYRLHEFFDDFTSRIHYWSSNLLHLCRLSFHSQVFVMDVEVYIVELCCLLLFLVRKDLLWLHFIPGINVTSFKSLM